jgi:glycosyltransferase involved in cell wall biosynthesis
MQPAGQIKRIGLFLGIEPHAGGMFQYAQSLLEALRSFPSDYEIHVACANDAWVSVLKNYPFQVTYLKRGALGLKFAALSMLLQLPLWLTTRVNPIAAQLRRLRCDLWIFPAQDAVAYQAGVPFVATIHDLMHRYEPHFPEAASGWRHSIREHRFRNLAKKSCAILVDSEVGRHHVVESYGTDPQKIFPLPYIPPRYILESKEPSNFDERYPLPKKFFFYPAQFWAHKNHRALIDAAAAIRTGCPDIHVVFTGGKRHAYEGIAAYVVRAGIQSHVTFSGYVPDEYLPGFYRRARALIMPTFFGPTNIPPLEAIACGCPVAVSRIYGMPEQLGDAALYFDPHSVTEMAEIIQKLWLEDALCQQLKQRGQDRLALWGQTEFNALLLSYVMTTTESR